MFITKFIQRWAAFFVGFILSFYVVFVWIRLFFQNPRSFFTWKKLTAMPSCMTSPALGTHGFIHLEDTVRIHYVSLGDENKPLMLFLHGFPTCWYLWRYQMREFKNEYRVIAIDLRGYGESDKPKGIHNYSVTKLLGDIKELITAFGYTSCVLVGHNFGAFLAWAFTANYQDMVDKLIVMNSPHPKYFRRYMLKNFSQVKKMWFLFFFQIPILPEMSFRLRDYAALDEIFSEENIINISYEANRAYKYAMSRPGTIRACINYVRAAFVYPHNCFPKVTRPVLTIWGCNDMLLEREIVAHYSTKVSDHQVKYFEIASHWVMTDIPDSVNRCMREWLTNYY